MYPVLHPGSLVLIDEGKRRIATGGWTNEFDRPIYFLEHRTVTCAAGVRSAGDQLLVQPHPASQQKPVVFDAGEIDVIGQVIGVAMLLESKKRRHARSAAVPEESPNP